MGKFLGFQESPEGRPFLSVSRSIVGKKTQPRWEIILPFKYKGIMKQIPNSSPQEKSEKEEEDIMTIFQVYDMREKVIKSEGAGALSPCCGGSVIAMLLDCNLRVFCIPIFHKTKTKFFCSNCSHPLIVRR